MLLLEAKVLPKLLLDAKAAQLLKSNRTSFLPSEIAEICSGHEGDILWSKSGPLLKGEERNKN